MKKYQEFCADLSLSWLSKRTLSAFTHAVKTDLVGTSVAQRMQHALSTHTEIEAGLQSGIPFDQYVINMPLASEGENQILVNTDKELESALHMGWILMDIEEPLDNPNERFEKISETLDHERKHRSALVGSSEFLSGYYLSFFKDRNSGNTLFVPSTSIVGRVPLSLFLTLVEGPEHLSATDKIYQSLRKYDPNYKKDLSGAV